jgi:hypothetical protein
VTETGQIIKGASRKRIFWLGFVLLIIFVLLFFFSGKDAKKTTFVNPTRKPNPLLEDKDRDGLKAWEEQLYGTDPNVADTDGDGILDGEEINQKRNPLRNEDSPEIPNNSSESKEPVNLTTVLIDELIKSGGAANLVQGDGETPSQILFKKLDALIAEGKVLSAKNLSPTPQVKTHNDTSVRAVKEYLTTLADIFIRNVSALKKDDLDLFLEILESNRLERLGEIGDYRKATEKTLGEIRQILVPKTLAWFHAREIELLQQTAQQLALLENAERDPVAALAAVPQRVETKIAFITLHRSELVRWLNTNKITLQANEKAAFLFR